MSNDLNQCNFIGRLGKDVDLRYTSDGKPIANFSIAVGESWKNKSSGQKQEKTTWINVVIFGALSEIAGKYLQKGSKVFISGKYQVREWQDKEGNKRYNHEIVIDQFNGTMQMLDSINQNETNQQSQNQQQQGQQMNNSHPQPQNQQTNQQTDSEGFSDDIPF